MFQTLIDPAFLAFENGGTPVLDLNFAATKALDSRITFTRASSGTFIDSAGLVQTASTNVARFTHNPVTIASQGLLIEGERTNLLLRSEEFDNASWGKSESSVSSNSLTAPDGNLTADKLIESSATNVHNANQTFAATSGTTYTFSVFLKRGERSFALMALIGAFTTTSVQVNLLTGAVSTGTGSPLSATVQSFPNGWFRVSFSLAATSTATATALIYTSTDGVWANRVYTGDGTSGFCIWGAQVEAGSFVTSYIATTTASATRAAESAVMTGTNFSAWYNQSQGTIVLDAAQGFTIPTSTFLRPFDISNSTATERISAYTTLLSSDNRVYVQATTGGSVFAEFSPAGALGTGPFKIAISYSTAAVSAAVNGNAATSDVTVSAFTPDRLTLGALVAQSSTTIFNGTIARFRFFNRALANSVQAIST